MEAHSGSSFSRAERGRRSTAMVNYFLRLLALVTSFTAAVVAGAAKETEPVAVDGRGGGAKLEIKAVGTPQFDYFVVVNAVACVYSAVSLGLWAAARGDSKNLVLVLAVADLAAAALLFAGLGSAAAMAVLFRRGATPTTVYPRVCNVYDFFCGLVFAAIAMSAFAAGAFFVLVVISLFKLHYSSL